MRFKLVTLFKLTTAAALIIGSLVAYRLHFPIEAEGATAVLANRALWKDLKLPASATDVTFYVDQYGCEAEFAISEHEFLAWWESRDWTLIAITNPVPYFEPVRLPEDERLVADGYEATIPDGIVVFDRSRSRAAFWASTFP